MNNANENLLLETTERQRKYVEEQEAKGGGLGVVFADAFLRGMRDLGYKSPAWALCEMVDNSVQAGAAYVAFKFGFQPANTSQSKPDMIAIIDNGVGMIPEMIGYSVRWGGTDRENNRNGFGRYGYGLPSSAVSMAKRYTVYSKIKGGTWHGVTVDIDELAKVAGDFQVTNKMLTAKAMTPPAWTFTKSMKIDPDTMKSVVRFDPAAMESGTTIVLEDIDRLRKLGGWITAKALKPKLLQHFGLTYRHWIPQPTILVDDEPTQPVDPLFLMENGRFYNETTVLARPIETRAFEIETTRGSTGRVKIRASYLPPSFQKKDPNAPVDSRATNSRHEIMKDNNGIIICREGRQIDCIPPRFTKFQNWDVNVKIEIDFSPELDEFFGITTAKQQIVIEDEMWDRLEQKGKLRDLVSDIRSLRDDDINVQKGRQQNEGAKDEPRRSEQAMVVTEKFETRPDQPTDTEKQQAEKQLVDAATKLAETTNRPKADIIKELQDRAAKRKFEVEFQAGPEGPFYRPSRLGEQKRLIVNTLHPFYTKVYSVATPDGQAALEVLLLVLGEAELKATGEFRSFYISARGHWSERLRHALDALTPDEAMRDKASVVAEQMQIGLDELVDSATPASA